MKDNTLIIKCGIFMGAVCALFLLLSLFIALARSNWEKGLLHAAQSLFSEQDFCVGKRIFLSEKNDVAICFELLEKPSAEKPLGMVLILRATTYYGPVPAVFVWQNGKTSFKGIAYLKSSVAREFLEGRNAQIDFWLLKAEKIFEDAKKSLI